LHRTEVAYPSGGTRYGQSCITSIAVPLMGPHPLRGFSDERFQTSLTLCSLVLRSCRGLDNVKPRSRYVIDSTMCPALRGYPTEAEGGGRRHDRSPICVRAVRLALPPVLVKPAPPCKPACSSSCRTLVLFLDDMCGHMAMITFDTPICRSQLQHYCVLGPLQVPIIPVLGTTFPHLRLDSVRKWYHIMKITLCYRNHF
jgi:hypothetical protein